jgi:hypothetical protein
MLTRNKLLLILVCVALFGSLTSCKDDPAKPDVVKPDLVFYGLSDNNQISAFNAMNAASAMNTVTISGLGDGEKLLAIDFRPATGQLYGLGSNSRLYTINFETGTARAVGSASFSPALSGNIAGFDFNPTVDRIRLVTSTGQNLRLNPENGQVAATDKPITGVSGASVTSVAYTSNKAGASATTLFDIDFTNQKLYKQDPPNDGVLVEVGGLGVSATGESGFDISPSDVALAALTVNGNAGLYQIDLSTGKAALLGSFTSSVIGIAIPTDPVAYAVDDVNNLHIFNPTKPEPVTKAIAGLQDGETMVGLDFRPANGQLYALGSSSRMYTLNAASGAATMVGVLPLTTALSGTAFGFDFNPTVDRIRVVSNTGQNLRLHPETGLVAAIDKNLTPTTTGISGAAYTNNFAGATSTVLYDIDVNANKLYKQDPPNDGVLVEVGNLGVDPEAANGFDIGSKSGKAYALLTVGSSTKIYTIDLSSGMATAVADFPKTVRAMTVGLGF